MINIIKRGTEQRRAFLLFYIIAIPSNYGFLIEKSKFQKNSKSIAQYKKTIEEETEKWDPNQSQDEYQQVIFFQSFIFRPWILLKTRKRERDDDQENSTANQQKKISTHFYFQMFTIH